MILANFVIIIVQMQNNINHSHSHQILEQLTSYFPKKPYQIQLNIAQTLFQALNSKDIKLAIIQSPTGTGKTYSLLVPLIAWLNRNQSVINNLNQASNKKLPSWLKPSQQKGEKILNEKIKNIKQAIHAKDAREIIRKNKLLHITNNKNKKASEQDQDLQIHSQEEGRNDFKKKINKKIDAITEKQLKMEDQVVLPKIIFVSRTHSQLSQVIQSIKLILKQNKKELKYIQIASKQHFCINNQVNSHKQSISQKCQNLLDHSHCPYFHQLDISQFFNTDIEQATKIGKQNSLCPYFAIRNVLDYCDIICLPYTSILNADIRNKIGININNSIIVFDQGHNVIDFQKQIHSPEIKCDDLILMAQQLDQYLKKYQERLKIKNVNLLINLLEIIRALIAVIERYSIEKRTKNDQKQYLKVNYLNFLLDLAIKEFNIQKIIKYVSLNSFDKKLSYFNSDDKNKNKKYDPKSHTNAKISVSQINLILGFLLELAIFNINKQILIIKWNQLDKASLKILCLQGDQLQKIVNQSRMTIIAGGTMEPLDDLTALFTGLKEKTIIKRYPHIIKQSQCQIFIVKNCGAKEIIFNHQTSKQDNSSNYKDICKSVLNKVIHNTEKGGGIVIFIQNYKLLEIFKDIFKNEAYYSKMIFDGRNKVDGDQEEIFKKYKKCIDEDKVSNYILVSVMGGKLSQGINFSDRLARSLVVFGLPYPNINSAEIIENMEYYNKKESNHFTGKEYFQNLCIKTLNQTIGRGVRHKDDYVNIYLIDKRFQKIKSKLSSWMQKNIKIINDITIL